jgi:hypothetical protein
MSECMAQKQMDNISEETEQWQNANFHCESTGIISREIIQKWLYNRLV